MIHMIKSTKDWRGFFIFVSNFKIKQNLLLKPIEKANLDFKKL